jgi:hypothetical protein
MSSVSTSPQIPLFRAWAAEPSPEGRLRVTTPVGWRGVVQLNSALLSFVARHLASPSTTSLTAWSI